jgi:hypothetical protein
MSHAHRIQEILDREVTALGGVAPGVENPPDERGQVVVLAIATGGTATAMTITVN